MKVSLKVFSILATLSVMAVVQANYELSCANSELSIRWPSYESNSEYYVCSRLFGRQMTVACKPGEVFTFALQSCTAPSRYIPAPALSVLPTAAPLLNKPNEDGYLRPIEIPNRPPPVVGPPVMDVPLLQPPVKPETYPMSPPVLSDRPKEEELNPIHEEENVAAVVVPVKPMIPSPPTPPPTPPAVVKDSSKKPSGASGKKPSSKKKKSPTSNSETPVVEHKPTKKPNKRTPAKKNGKQSSAVEKAPKKSSKKPKAADKKKSSNN